MYNFSVVSFSMLKPKPCNSGSGVQAVWDDLHEETICKSVLSFRKQLTL